MKILKFFNILISYKKCFFQIIFFEIYYLLKGYKQSSVKILNHDQFTDNIPCPYFFLYKINKFLSKNQIKTFVDLGCGGGRAIYFFNKLLKINFYGLENNKITYEGCKKLFKNNNNVEIINDNFLNFQFLNFKADCFFINDPLKKKDDFDNHYRNTIIDNSLEKIQYNVNFLSKLVDFFKTTNLQNISEEINNLITFNRKFEKWDTINKAIILVAISELRNSKKEKMKIILNDYIEVSKSFVGLKDGIISLILIEMPGGVVSYASCLISVGEYLPTASVVS